MFDPIHALGRPPAASGSHRLFFALWPDDATRVGIAAVAARLRQQAPGGRWIPMDRYHLTLHFLGTYRQLPAPLVDAACAAATDTRVPGCAIALDRVGSFRTRSHLWWLGCATPDPLLPLWAVLTRSLLERDIPVPSAPLLPHVTLLRGAGRAPRRDLAVEPVVWAVTGFALIHSQAGMRDRYRVLGQWPLPMP